MGDSRDESCDRIDNLTRRQKLAAAAWVFDRKPQAEIAAEFGVSRSAISKRIQRARQRLGRYADALSRGGRKHRFRALSIDFSRGNV